MFEVWVLLVVGVVCVVVMLVVIFHEFSGSGFVKLIEFATFQIFPLQRDFNLKEQQTPRRQKDHKRNHNNRRIFLFPKANRRAYNQRRDKSKKQGRSIQNPRNLCLSHRKRQLTTQIIT